MNKFNVSCHRHEVLLGRPFTSFSPLKTMLISPRCHFALIDNNQPIQFLQEEWKGEGRKGDVTSSLPLWSHCKGIKARVGLREDCQPQFVRPTHRGRHGATAFHVERNTICCNWLALSPLWLWQRGWCMNKSSPLFAIVTWDGDGERERNREMGVPWKEGRERERVER